MILFTHRYDNNDFAAAYMKDGHMGHSINNFDRTGTVTTVNAYNDNRYHRARLVKEGNALSITVDSEYVAGNTHMYIMYIPYILYTILNNHLSTVEKTKIHCYFICFPL